MSRPDRIRLHLTLAQANALHTAIVWARTAYAEQSERRRMLTEQEHEDVGHALRALEGLIA